MSERGVCAASHGQWARRNRTRSVTRSSASDCLGFTARLYYSFFAYYGNR